MTARFAACLALLTALIQVLPGPTRAAQPFDPTTAVAIDHKEGVAVPAEALFRDETGRPMPLGRLIRTGRPVLLVPLYYTCPNICGVTMATLFARLSEAGYRPGADFELVMLSIDPREGPKDAAKSRQDAARRWSGLAERAHFLTGDEPAIRQVTDAIGFHYAWDAANRQYAHASAVAVLTGAGVLNRWLYGFSYESGDLRLALTEAAKGRLGSLGDQILLLCCTFDPRTGTYSNAVMGGVRILGIGSAALLLGYVALCLWRERGRRLRQGPTP